MPQPATSGQQCGWWHDWHGRCKRWPEPRRSGMRLWSQRVHPGHIFAI